MAEPKITYLAWLKAHEQFDKYVLFLLSLGFSVEETSKFTETSRQFVYNVVERNKQMVADYMAGVKNITDRQ